MAAVDLKENFKNQLKEIDEKILQINEELNKAKEYKVKLLGGLETLELLIAEESKGVATVGENTGPPTNQFGMAEGSAIRPEDDVALEEAEK